MVLLLLMLCTSIVVLAQEQSTGPWSGAPVTMSATDEALVDVVEDLVRHAGLRVAIERGVDALSPMTAELREVPWDQALDQIAQVNGLEARVMGDLVVLSDSRGRPGLTRWQQER